MYERYAKVLADFCRFSEAAQQLEQVLLLTKDESKINDINLRIQTLKTTPRLSSSQRAWYLANRRSISSNYNNDNLITHPSARGSPNINDAFFKIPELMQEVISSHSNKSDGANITNIPIDQLVTENEESDDTDHGDDDDDDEDGVEYADDGDFF